MKRLFLIFVLIFLNACVSADVTEGTGCPASSGRRFSVLFDYGSVELSDSAIRQLEEAAEQARESGDYVCLLGRLEYRGVPAEQGLEALDRAKNVGEIFLQEGVRPEQIYIGFKAQDALTGFSSPQTAADERHVLEIVIGR